MKPKPSRDNPAMPLDNDEPDRLQNAYVSDLSQNNHGYEEPALGLKRLLVVTVLSMVSAIVFAILFAFLGRAIALLTFESDPIDLYEANVGFLKARARTVINYSLWFAGAGLVIGFFTPWIYVPFSRSPN